MMDQLQSANGFLGDMGIMPIIAVDSQWVRDGVTQEIAAILDFTAIQFLWIDAAKWNEKVYYESFHEKK